MITTEVDTDFSALSGRPAPRAHRLGDMRVQRVFDADRRGAHIEPALDQSWSELTTLRWWAAISALPARGEVKVSVTHGMSRRVDTRTGRRQVWDNFCLNVTGPGGSTGWSSADFETTRSRLDGIETALVAIYGGDDRG